MTMRVKAGCFRSLGWLRKGRTYSETHYEAVYMAKFIKSVFSMGVKLTNPHRRNRNQRKTRVTNRKE